MTTFSPGLQIRRTWPTLTHCPHCPRYNIEPTSPNQITCGATHCRLMQNRAAQKACRERGKRG